MCLDVLPFKILCERRTTKYNLSRRVTRLEYKNGQCPMFEMSIIRSQHFHKAFFLSPTSQTSQPAFVLGIKLPLPIVNAVSSLVFWIHLRHNKQGQSRINFTLRATFPSWFYLLRGVLHNILGKPHWRCGYLDTVENWCYMLTQSFQCFDIKMNLFCYILKSSRTIS